MVMMIDDGGLTAELSQIQMHIQIQIQIQIQILILIQIQIQIHSTIMNIISPSFTASLFPLNDEIQIMI